MKKALLSLFILLPLLSSAQSTVTIGPKAGVGYSFLTGGDQPPNSKFYTGFAAGGFITVSGNSRFGFTGELLFARKGTTYSVDVPASGNTAAYTGTGTLKFQYIDIPLLFRVFAGNPESRVRPNFFIGPSLNFLLSSKFKVEAMGQSDELDWKNVTPGFDLGAVVGLGVNIKTADRQWFNVDVRYNQSVTTASQTGSFSSNGQTAQVTKAGTFYNAGVLVNVGYGFGI